MPGLLSMVLLGMATSAVVAFDLPASTSTVRPQLGEQIIGKWVSADQRNKDAVIEFRNDGSLQIHVASINLAGKYRVLDDVTIELELSIPGPKPPDRQRIKVQIKEQEMITTNPDGSMERLKRTP